MSFKCLSFGKGTRNQIVGVDSNGSPRMKWWHLENSKKVHLSTVIQLRSCLRTHLIHYTMDVYQLNRFKVRRLKYLNVNRQPVDDHTFDQRSVIACWTANSHATPHRNDNRNKNAPVRSAMRINSIDNDASVQCAIPIEWFNVRFASKLGKQCGRFECFALCCTGKDAQRQ